MRLVVRVCARLILLLIEQFLRTRSGQTSRRTTAREQSVVAILAVVVGHITQISPILGLGALSYAMDG